jgi:hypothetical protein
MSTPDSIDKIVTTYFAAVNNVEFEYKGKVYPRKPLSVSPKIVQGYTCPPACGGCCPRFTLDYLPEEDRPSRNIKLRTIPFNKRHIEIFSDLQEANYGHHCINLRHSDGRCLIHGHHPFSCDFELIRFMHSHTETGINRVMVRQYGRAWAMLRVDDQQGARCEILPPDTHTISETRRKLVRLQQWATHFRLSTRVPKIIKWINDRGYESNEPLVI